ncbi:PAQR6 protein, partial [Polyodon spathula]|nr:PAQR6 protein [Polyodon spathula]
PQVFQEDGIISGYRHPRSSALDCILSSFQMTNETVNIWTHFLPTWYFLWQFCVLCSTLDFWSECYSWPLLVYMLLICLYPFTSSCAHTFSSMSAEARHVCYFFDYGALSLYSLGCAITYGAYVMPDCWINSVFHHCFVPVAVLNTLVCTALSCYSRFPELEFPRWSKILRTAAFVYPFVFDNIPLFYRVSSGSPSPIMECQMGQWVDSWEARDTTLLSQTRLRRWDSPREEVLCPVFFHPLQKHHCCVVCTAQPLCQETSMILMEAILADMSSRRGWLAAHTPMPSFLGSVGAVSIGVVLNLAIIGLFSATLLWTPSTAH